MSGFFVGEFQQHFIKIWGDNDIYFLERCMRSQHRLENLLLEQRHLGTVEFRLDFYFIGIEIQSFFGFTGIFECLVDFKQLFWYTKL